MARTKEGADYTYSYDRLGEVVSYLSSLGIKGTHLSERVGVGKFEYYNILRNRNLIKRKELLDSILTNFPEYFLNNEIQSGTHKGEKVVATPFGGVHSDKYVTLLEKDRERLEKENERLEKENKQLMQQIMENMRVLRK